MNTLILYLGNPIVKNDRIGILIGHRLEDALRDRDDLEIREFIGSPLDLVSELSDYRDVIFVDAIASGKVPPGTVVVFNQDELTTPSTGGYPHGLNFAEALALFKKLGTPMPERMHLIGIEVPNVWEFGETLSGELETQFDDICAQVLDATNNLLSTGE